jgi:hypothetical protein
MRTIFVRLSIITAALLVLAPRATRACGGGFGHGLNIDPAQKILVVHKAGVETYVFRPHFCGLAAEFGLILPVPEKFAQAPLLADAKLFDELEAHSAPKIVTQTLCAPPTPGGGRDAGSRGYGDGGSNQGVNVVDRGKVGIFDWALLKADSSAAFTDWLDAAKFPYDKKAVDHFAYYVTKGWHFVAFKVTADTKAPPSGYQLCGDLGPIQLTFPSKEAIVPTRIAAAASGSYHFGWRLFTIAAKQLRVTMGPGSDQLRFSGSLEAADLAKYPELAKLAAPGDRLTKIDSEFWSSSIAEDIVLREDPAQADFRQTIIQYVHIKCDGGIVLTDAGTPKLTEAGATIPAPRDDGGCALAGSSSGAATGALALLGLALLGLALVARGRRIR